MRTRAARWHPVSEEWVDADLPLPDSEAAAAAEHAEMIEREREEQRPQLLRVRGARRDEARIAKRSSWRTSSAPRASLACAAGATC